jgi:hypothetical protein
MSIDGVGKPPGGPGGIGGPGGAGGIGKSGETFQVDSPDATSSAQGSGALGQLQRGEISVEQYLDTRVEQALEHLQSKLSSEQLDFVRNNLREQLASDPVLVELVRRATGGAAAERG